MGGTIEVGREKWMDRKEEKMDEKMKELMDS